jgi:hypothetical protein
MTRKVGKQNGYPFYSKIFVGEITPTKAMKLSE